MIAADKARELVKVKQDFEFEEKHGTFMRDLERKVKHAAAEGKRAVILGPLHSISTQILDKLRELGYTVTQASGRAEWELSW